MYASSARKNGYANWYEFKSIKLNITLHKGLKMSEYEVYWLSDFPLIIYWARAKK